MSETEGETDDEPETIVAFAMGGFAGRVTAGSDRPVRISQLPPPDRDRVAQILALLSESEPTARSDEAHYVRLGRQVLIATEPGESAPVVLRDLYAIVRRTHGR